MGERARTKFGATFRASFVLFGTIVGAGIFGLPYVIQQSGYAAGVFWLVVLAAAVTLTHLLYGEVVLATPGQHRLIGYVGIHLGPWARRVEAIASIIGLFGSSLAYLILGGLFVSQIVSHGMSPAWGSALLFVFGLLAVRWGTAFLSGVDFWMTLVEMGSFLLLSAVALTAFDATRLATMHFENAVLPYGIVLFAYGGMTAITEVRDIVGGDAKKVRRSIVWGTLMAAALTTLFATAVLGALGEATTPEAVAGLSAKFGGALPLIGAIAGFFSVLTSYIVFSDYLNKQFRQDFKVGPFLAAAAAVGLPFLLYLVGVRSFGKILELVGAVLIGVEGMFVCAMYLKVKKKSPRGVLFVPNGVVYALMTVYAAGAVYALAFAR